jgi:hypothetical protein
MITPFQKRPENRIHCSHAGSECNRLFCALKGTQAFLKCINRRVGHSTVDMSLSAIGELEFSIKGIGKYVTVC